MATPEALSKDAVRRTLELFAPHVDYFLPAANGLGEDGTPDFVGAVRWVMCPLPAQPALHFAVETKADAAEGGKGPTKRQLARIARVQFVGGQAFLVRSKEDLIALHAWLCEVTGLRPDQTYWRSERVLARRALPPRC